VVDSFHIIGKIVGMIDTTKVTQFDEKKVEKGS
jgi:hypothetical protein